MDKSINAYSADFTSSQDTSSISHHGERESSQAQSMTETFYNLVTDFYEYGYGRSFHFAPLYDEKSFQECISSYEEGVGKMIGAKPGMKILDVGCGVGGPGREVARTSGAHVMGLNYNSYQIERAKKHSKKEHLDHLCSYMKGDFCSMVEIEDSSFDGAFAIEATCHSKDLGLVYREIFRVLKPGALFADMAWCVTEDYDPQNSKHVKVIKDLMYGNSLSVANSEKQTVAALREAGFEVVEFRDLVKDGDYPWYSILENSTCCSFKNFRMTSTGRFITNTMLYILETFSLVPKGTIKVSAMLEMAALSLVESGKMGIFTPMFRCLARKPLQ